MIASGELQIVIFNDDLPAFNRLLDVDGITHVAIDRVQKHGTLGTDRAHVTYVTHNITVRFSGDAQRIINELADLMPARSAVA